VYGIIFIQCLYIVIYCLISHSTTIYHFRRVPKMLPNKRFESGGGIINGNTGIFRRNSGCLLLLLLFFFSFSFCRFWQARCSTGAVLPPQVTNRSLDSSQISRDRFLTRQDCGTRSRHTPNSYAIMLLRLGNNSDLLSLTCSWVGKLGNICSILNMNS